MLKNNELHCWIRHRKTSGGLVPYLQLHANSVALIGILGKPSGPIAAGKVFSKENGVTIKWRIAGAVEVNGANAELSAFSDSLLERCKNYNNSVMYGVYKCRNALEWSLMRSAVGDSKLIPTIDALLVKQWKTKQTVGQWQLI